MGQSELILPPKSDPAIASLKNMQNVIADYTAGGSNSLEPRMVPTAS